MLIVALVLAVIGLAALVTAVVTSNELVAWVCIAASALGVILLIVDAVRERTHRRNTVAAAAAAGESAEPTGEAADDGTVDYPDDVAAEDHPEELVSDDPESDLPSDDEPELPEPAEQAAIHIVDESAETGESGAEDLDENLDENPDEESGTSGSR